MGIVNVTPDSFSDGGRYGTAQAAIARALEMVAQGAAIVDFGGESTRPGAVPLDWRAEWARLEPVLDGFRAGGGNASAVASVDTYHPETARLALERGVAMINCVYAEPAEEMLALCRESGAALVLPSSREDLLDRRGDCTLYLDPMIGFGTTREDDLALLKGVRELAKRAPVVVGASRKRIVRKLAGETQPGETLGANIAVSLWAALSGADVVRVHDVKETVQAIKTMEALCE